ncbi:hypothetical protein B5P44_00720 [Mycobacterium sp. CBMA 213]|nr:hypothetical protein [Mycolicibacterium sp. CBMA 213]
MVPFALFQFLSFALLLSLFGAAGLFSSAFDGGKQARVDPRLWRAAAVPIRVIFGVHGRQGS